MLVEIGDLRPQKRWSVRGAGRVVAIFVHPDSGELVATDGRCPHGNAPMQDGWMWEGGVVCPFHRYRFDPQDGRCENSERYRLLVYPVVVQDGRTYAEVPFNPLGDHTYPRSQRRTPRAAAPGSEGGVHHVPRDDGQV